MSSRVSGQAPFRVASCYDALRQTCALAAPVVRAAQAVVEATTVSCRAPILSLVSLGCLLFLALHPTLILPIFLLLLLRFSIWSYVYKVLYRGQPHTLDQEWRAMTLRAAVDSVSQAAPSSGNSSAKKRSGNAIVSALASINPLNIVPLFKRKKNDVDDESNGVEYPDVQLLDRILRPHIKSALSIIGVHTDEGAQGLTRLQHQWTRALDSIEAIYDAASWNDTSSFFFSRMLVLGIIGALAWCYVGFSQAYLVAIIGTFLLTRETIAGQNLSFLLTHGAAIVQGPVDADDKKGQ